MTDQALISAKETSDGITSAIGLNKGMFTWDNLLSAAIALVVCILAIMIIMRIMRRMFARSKMEPSLANFILKVIKIALEFAAIMIVAGSLGFDVTALLAVFSLLGLAISLSVQNLLGNLVSGVVLLMNKPIRDGDYIQAGGAEGVVKNIGLFYTELNTLDNKVVNVPNSELSAGQIVNFTREPNRRVDLVVGASYDCDTEEVKNKCASVIANALSLQDTPDVETVNKAMAKLAYLYGLQVVVIDQDITIELADGSRPYSGNPFADDVVMFSESKVLGATYWKTPADVKVKGSAALKAMNGHTLIKKYAEEEPLEEVTMGIANAFPAWLTSSRTYLCDVTHSSWSH